MSRSKGPATGATPVLYPKSVVSSGVTHDHSPKTFDWWIVDVISKTPFWVWAILAVLFFGKPTLEFISMLIRYAFLVATQNIFQ